MNRILLSIIIPVYNVEKYIHRCLTSCCKQSDASLDEYEIIIINDGTPDNSMDVVYNIAKKYSNIVIFNQKNKGLSVARNQGLEIAKGEYVQFLDSDDWIASNDVSTIKGIIVGNKVDIISICARNMISGYIRNQIPKTIQTGKELLVNGRMTHCACFYVYNRAFLQSHGLFFMEGIFHEDSEFTPRVIYHAQSLIACQSILYNVNDEQHDSITRTYNIKRCFDNIIVADSLFHFCNEIVKEKVVQAIFYYTCSRMVNNGLRHAKYFSLSQRKKVDNFLYDKRYLLKAYKLSTSLFHRLEYFIFEYLRIPYTMAYAFISGIKDRFYK